jgi:hypothetical protein
MWHKEKTAKWKVTQATAGKNAEESESLGLKRMLVLLYEMAASSFPAMIVANVITPSLNSEEEVGKALAVFQAALAVRKVGVYAVRVVDEEDVKRKTSSKEDRESPITSMGRWHVLYFKRQDTSGRCRTYYSEYHHTECAVA